MKSATKGTLRTAARLSLTLAAIACGTPTEVHASTADEAPARTTSSDQPHQTTTTLYLMGPNMGFVGFDHAESLSGQNVAVTTDLMLSRTTVMQPRDAAVDSRGALYLVSRADDGSVAVYDNPLAATASRAPDRKVFGDATQISKSPTGIAIDRERNLLYVSNVLSDVLVFDISNPEAFDGAVEPVRTFKIDVAHFRPEQIFFANGALYMVDARGDTSDIIAFDNPAKLLGKVKPDRTIAHGGFDNKIGIFVDAKDRLWVGVRKIGQVLMFNDASTLDGFASPDVALSIAGANVDPKPSFAAVDSHDRLYVADASGNVAFSFDNASALVTGERTPNRTIACKEVIAPNRLLLVERSDLQAK